MIENKSKNSCNEIQDEPVNQSLAYFKRNWLRIVINSIVFNLALIAVMIIVGATMGVLKINKVYLFPVLVFCFWSVCALMFSYYAIRNKKMAKQHTMFLAFFVYCSTLTYHLRGRSIADTSMALVINFIVISSSLLAGWWLSGVLKKKDNGPVINRNSNE